jgi:hypothetical protein
VGERPVPVGSSHSEITLRESQANGEEVSMGAIGGATGEVEWGQESAWQMSDNPAIRSGWPTMHRALLFPHTSPG